MQPQKETPSLSASSTVDAEEIARFTKIAEEWWDPQGKFKPLHRINPLRIGYIRDHVMAHFHRDTDSSAPFEGLSLVDIGCGGGLIAEPMCRLGAAVTGVDAGEKNIKTASVHAEQSGLAIDYQHSTAEALAATGAQFDVVLALEVIEHVADVDAFITACAALVKPGGLLFLTTINRTAKSYAFAIIGAEYILRWLPRGTHQWEKFLKPSEIAATAQKQGLAVHEIRGMVMHPLSFEWKLSATDLDVNYLMVCKK